MNQVTDEQEEAVIGRMQIDNYLMGVMRKDWPTLATTTTTTTTFSTTTVSELVDATVVGRRKGNDNEEEDVICSNRNS